MLKDISADQKNLSLDSENAEYESCVLCGRTTDVNRNTPIEFRMGYVEGAGQLCPGCRELIYGVMRECKQ